MAILIESTEPEPTDWVLQLIGALRWLVLVTIVPALISHMWVEVMGLAYIIVVLSVTIHERVSKGR